MLSSNYYWILQWPPGLSSVLHPFLWETVSPNLNAVSGTLTSYGDTAHANAKKSSHQESEFCVKIQKQLRLGRIFKLLAMAKVIVLTTGFTLESLKAFKKTNTLVSTQASDPMLFGISFNE